MSRAFLVLSLLLLALPGCRRGGQEAAENTPPPEIVLGAEDTAVVVRGPIESGPLLSGSLRAQEQATVRAQIGGTVLETYAEPGEQVGRGTTLARLDEASLRDSLTSARLAVTNARSQLTLAEREAERQRVLEQAGAVAQRNVETASQQVVTARTALAQARASVSAAEKQIGYTRITAPLTGVVSEKPVSAGDVVQPGTALYTVVDPSSLELEAAVPAERLSALEIGNPVEFTVNGFPGRTFRGRITRINPSADPVTRQVRVYTEILNPGELVTGLYAEGRVTSEQAIGLTVPEEAIDRRMVKPAVLRVHEGKIQRVEVQLGLVDRQAQRVEIRRGVQEGDVVLVGAAQEIAPGTPVKLAPEAQQKTDRLAQLR